MGQFKKGEPRHPKAGRRKGTENKSTEAIRKQFSLLLENNIDGLQAELDRLKGKQKIDAVCAIANHVLPKMSTIEADIGPREFIITDGTELGLP